MLLKTHKNVASGAGWQPVLGAVKLWEFGFGDSDILSMQLTRDFNYFSLGLHWAQSSPPVTAVLAGAGCLSGSGARLREVVPKARAGRGELCKGHPTLPLFPNQNELQGPCRDCHPGVNLCSDEWLNFALVFRENKCGCLLKDQTTSKLGLLLCSDVVLVLAGRPVWR